MAGYCKIYRVTGGNDMKTKTAHKILLHACPRCGGDLFPDTEEEDFACLQCGRRLTTAQLIQRSEARPQEALAPAA